jgi:glycosyltransferase involved in cell wall biosynthesis
MRSDRCVQSPLRSTCLRERISSRCRSAPILYDDEMPVPPGTSSQPKVSVLLTSYNHARYIGDAIDSVLAQTYTNLECIVIDDGSRDDSVARIREYGDRIRLLQKKNGGQASAINLGRTTATGSLICFLDSDDVWEPTKVAVVVDEACRASSPGLILHNVGTLDASGVADRRPSVRNMWSGNLERYVWKTGPWWPRPPTCGVSIPARLFDLIAPIPEEHFRISPDAYILTLGAFLGPVIAVPDVLAYWRCHGQNATHASLEERCNRQLRFLAGINLGLRERLSITRQINADDVWWHQLTRYQAGAPVSPTRLSLLALGNRAAPLPRRVADFLVVWRDAIRRRAASL